jgi:hypothetical protein
MLVSRVEQVIETKIESKVNGKIKSIDEKLTNYIDLDMKWKEENRPALDNMKNLTITGKTLIKSILVAGSLAGAIIGLRKLLNL